MNQIDGNCSDGQPPSANTGGQPSKVHPCGSGMEGNVGGRCGRRRGPTALGRDAGDALQLVQSVAHDLRPPLQAAQDAVPLLHVQLVGLVPLLRTSMSDPAWAAGPCDETDCLADWQAPDPCWCAAACEPLSCEPLLGR